MILIHTISSAEEITTGNLLPNVGNNASNAQSVDNTIPQIGNDFNSFTSSNATNFTSEIEVTGTGSISYSSSLLNITTGNDTTTQQKLNNGITLQGNTVVQNCEWSQSSYACGNRGVGQDSYSTKIQILNESGSVISETNQIRNNDAGYGSNAHKYTDTLIYNNTGAYTFNWQWTGIDGESNPRNLGGPNLLGANLFMTYDNSILDESVTEELTNITKNLTNTLREVIIEEEVKVKAAPTINTTTTAVSTKQVISTPSTKTPVQTKSATIATTKSTTKTNGNKNAKLNATTTSSRSTKNTKNESKKEISKESNSKTSTTTTAKKEDSSKQETVQSKETTGENKTASSEVQSQSGSIDLQMAKVDSDIKDISKNLEIKNIIKLKAMVNNDMITAYNIPFYIGKDIYIDQLNIFDKPIYQDVNLGQYILSDPVVQSKIKIMDIQNKKQKLLNEIEVLKNG
tara:strand:+ start:36 stop:1409 length:1374 start_codon:yes stop_codon:yes gene_type:complete